jgi:hypothetical protein
VPSHAAEQEETGLSWAELASRLVPDSPDWPGGEAPGYWGEEPPAWLDEDYQDPEDEALILLAADYVALSAECEAEAAGDRERRLAQVTGDFGTGYAHVRGDRPLPGVHVGPGRDFAQGMPCDGAAPDLELASAADRAAGPARDFAGVSDDALLGVLWARRRLTARQDWERLMTIGEIIRRRPAAGCALEGPARMPRVWLEGAAREIGAQLAVSNREASVLLGLAADLLTRLPMVSAALRDGIIDLDKARTLASRTAVLTDEEAGQAERLFFANPDVESMTWGTLSNWIAHAVITVNPEAAVRRRKDRARDGRVVLKPEGSGNYSLAGRELPAAAALKMDKAITARARELKKAGVAGSMQRLRMLAFLEAWNSEDPYTSTHGIDDDREDDPEYAAEEPEYGEADGQADEGWNSNAEGRGDGGTDGTGNGSEHILGGWDSDGNDGRDRHADGDQEYDGPGDDGPGDDGGNGNGGGRGPQPHPAGAGGNGGCACGRDRGQDPAGAGTGRGAGIAGWLNLTAPLLTLEERAERAGWLHGAGPVDPEQTRDLASTILDSDTSTICLTALDKDGRAAAHACARPGPADRTRRRSGRDPALQEVQGVLDEGRAPPGESAGLVQVGKGPPGSLGTWRLTTADRELYFTFENLAGPCDHAHQTAAHDPGRLLQHLTNVLNRECTFTNCRTPHRSCDYEHSTPHDKGGITCLCACGPVCRRNHLDKQQPGWKIDPGPARGWFKWTLPSGRTYMKGPTIYPG